MTFFINDHNVPLSHILDWEFKRLIHSYKWLNKRKECKFTPMFYNALQKKDNDIVRQEILAAKLALGLDTLRQSFSAYTTLGNTSSILGTYASRNHRKLCSTDIVVTNSHLTPEDVLHRISYIMMINTPEHLAINLNSNPDHYVLQSVSDSVQEVLKFTGGSPLPTRFFARYGEDEGLTSTISPGFTAQLFGTAKLENGQIIGGVRHQVKREDNGFRFRALVEFPSILPNNMIKEHQLHLACEFGHWINAILDDSLSVSSYS